MDKYQMLSNEHKAQTKNVEHAEGIRKDSRYWYFTAWTAKLLLHLHEFAHISGSGADSGYC
eukprot:scaffold35487_cov15-Tisochrysis_lutea.AAC.1